MTSKQHAMVLHRKKCQGFQARRAIKLQDRRIWVPVLLKVVNCSVNVKIVLRFSMQGPPGPGSMFVRSLAMYFSPFVFKFMMTPRQP